MKPSGLIATLIDCVTLEGEVVLDPCAGSFVVADVANQLKRNFVATDIVYGETL
jgi:DNA modification methylase